MSSEVEKFAENLARNAQTMSLIIACRVMANELMRRVIEVQESDLLRQDDNPAG